MAYTELLTAVRNQLRTTITDMVDDCIDIEPEPGNPPGFSGQEYISIVGNGWGPSASMTQDHFGLDEEYGVRVILTRRTGYVPEDRMMEEVILKEVGGMETRMREILTSILLNRHTIRIADAECYEPLRWLGCDPWPRVVGPDWFLAAPDPNSAGNPNNYGLVWEARFGGAKRLSKLGV